MLIDLSLTTPTACCAIHLCSGNDDASSNCAANNRASVVAGLQVNAGTTYYIVVQRYNAADTFNVQLYLTGLTAT